MKRTICVLFVNSEDKMLILKRSPREDEYSNKWSVIAGSIESGETPKECFKREILEETGIENWENLESKEPYFFEDGDFKRMIYPYRCKISNSNIKLNYEHTEYKWVNLEELLSLDLAEPVRSVVKVFHNI